MRITTDSLLIPGVLSMDFPAAFDVAAAAVYKRLLHLNGGVPLPKTESPGLLEIKVAFQRETWLSLAVQKRTDDISTFDAAMAVPKDPIQLISFRRDNVLDFHHLACTLYTACARAIVESIRYTHTEYGLCYLDEVTTPPPLINGPGDWIRLFLWQDIHAPEMQDEELGRRISRDPQTIRNHRRDYRRLFGERQPLPPSLQRTSRGRSRKK